MKTTRHFQSYLAQFFLAWGMFQSKVVEKIKTHILFSIAFFFLTCMCLRRSVWKKKSCNHNIVTSSLPIPIRVWCNMYTSSLRHIHDPVLLSQDRNYTCLFKSCLWYNVEKYLSTRQSSDDNMVYGVACCIPKSTSTCSEYMLLIDLSLQQWMQKCALMLCYTYIVCLVVTCIHFFFVAKSFWKGYVSVCARYFDKYSNWSRNCMANILWINP